MLSNDVDGLEASIDDAVLTLRIDREHAGNALTAPVTMAMTEHLRAARRNPSVHAAVVTGTGERFFCIGGEKVGQTTYHHSATFPVVDLYEAIDTSPFPVIAAVNGYAVGGGNVLHTVCDLTIASEAAVFRQVGPSVGSFDAGFGTWYLEDTIGRKRAKEMWYLNRKYDAKRALEWGLVNEVVPANQLMPRVREVLDELLDRGPQAISALKVAFSARNTGVVGQSRMGHDLLLTHYLRTEEAAELARSFAAKERPDRAHFDR